LHWPAAAVEPATACQETPAEAAAAVEVNWEATAAQLAEQVYNHLLLLAVLAVMVAVAVHIRRLAAEVLEVLDLLVQLVLGCQWLCLGLRQLMHRVVITTLLLTQQTLVMVAKVLNTKELPLQAAAG
jgi:hypothetical protein